MVADAGTLPAMVRAQVRASMTHKVTLIALGVGAAVIAGMILIGLHRFFPLWGLLLATLVTLALSYLLIWASTRAMVSRVLAPFVPPGATLSCTVMPDGGLRYTGASGTTELRPAGIKAVRTVADHYLFQLPVGGQYVAIPVQLVDAAAVGRLASRRGHPGQDALPPLPAPGPVYQVVLGPAEVRTLRDAAARWVMSKPAFWVLIVCALLFFVLAIHSPFYILIGLLSFVTPGLLLYTTIKNVTLAAGLPQRTVFSDHGFHIDTPLVSSAIGYRDVTKLTQLPGAVAIVHQRRIAVILLDELCPPWERGRFSGQA